MADKGAKKAQNDGRMGSRLARARLSTVISISLVLLLTGVACMLLVNGGRISKYFKENMKLSVMLKQDATDGQAGEFCESLMTLPYIKGTTVITREQGIAELKQVLGEDFLDVFETAPIPVSIDLTLMAEYVSGDSLAMVKSALMAFPQVDEVVYQESLVSALNSNIRKISLILAVFVAFMLFISIVLISNTVRLSVYIHRFTVHTMKMVGATRRFIRKPFMQLALFQGIFSALLAIIILEGMLLLLKTQFPQMFEIFTIDLLLLVMGIITACGIILCTISTFFVVNRIADGTKDDLYV